MNTTNSTEESPGCQYTCQRPIFYSYACLYNELFVLRKLAKKRKETMSSTRQEMTVMVNSMDKSYAEQGTNCDEAFSFMDTHNLNGRCKCTRFLASSTSQWFSRIPDSTEGFKKKKQLLRELLCLIDFSRTFKRSWKLLHVPWVSEQDNIVKVMGPDERVQ